MKKLLNIFFVTLGVAFFIIILASGYFFVTDPFNLKPLLLGSGSSSSVSTSTQTHTFLSDEQAGALETFGIDPTSLPTEITAEQEACFEAALGAGRVAHIKAGDSPTMAEYFSAQSCF